MMSHPYLRAQQCSLTTHGLSKHPLHKVWKGIRSRVKLPHFRYYHGRGIVCCERWARFENFFADMVMTWRKGLEIDRINPAGPYSPDNCRWVTRAENCRNKTNSVWIVFRGQRLALADAVARFGRAPLSTAYARVRKGWDAEAAVLTPKTVNRKVPVSIDGQVFPTAKAAADALGVSRSAIGQKIRKHPDRAFYVRSPNQ